MPQDRMTGLIYTADEAYAKGECPECGVPLDGVNLQHHADFHWSRPIPSDVEFKEARRRRDLILNYKPAPTVAAAKE